MGRFSIGRPSHGTAVAYLALFVALGGSAYAVATIGPRDIEVDAVRSRHVKDGQTKEQDLRDGAVTNAKLADGAVTGAKVADSSLAIADLGWDHIGASVTWPTINAGQCAFVEQAVQGIAPGDSLLAYTAASWDSRLILTGVESSTQPNEVVLRICNWSGGNLGSDSGSVFLIRF